jgi:hypothetical protein
MKHDNSLMTKRLLNNMKNITLDEHLYICLALTKMCAHHVLDLNDQGRVVVRVKQGWPSSWEHAFMRENGYVMVILIKDYCKRKNLIRSHH